MPTTRGVRYLLARAAQDGRVDSTLHEIGRYDDREDVVLAEQARRTLDDLVWRRGAYTAADAHEAARRIRSTDAAVALGRRGGQSTTTAKSEAARENGRRGGRPKKRTT